MISTSNGFRVRNQLTPNPSIKQISKKLRFLLAAYVQRYGFVVLSEIAR